MGRGNGYLATIGAISPFVGLFGTVWGIMNSFIGIAQTQTTNESLRLGSSVSNGKAIPAVVIYNVFARQIMLGEGMQSRDTDLEGQRRYPVRVAQNYALSNGKPRR